jgi:hypothetical protein
VTPAELVAEIRADFEARPELAAALRRPERPFAPTRPQRPERPVPAAEPPAAPERRWRCGWGGHPRCDVMLERGRGLCAVHAAAMATLGRLERGRPRKVGTAAESRAPARKIDPAEIFDAGGRGTVPAAERAAHLARYVARIGGPVRRADALRVAGVANAG